MKNTSVSKFRTSCVKKISENDVDYELPVMMLIVIASVMIMLTITI